MRCVGHSEAITAWDAGAYVALFDLAGSGLTAGRSFRTLRVGPVARRMGGDTIATVTAEHLADMARLIRDRRDSDPVIIDWQHGSSPDNPQAPDVGGALGRLVDAYVEGDALVVVPAYTEKGAAVVAAAEGVLWSSPEFVLGDVFARDGAGRIGSAQVLAITLTPRPAQQADRIDAITLAESGDDNQETRMADPVQQVAAEEDNGEETPDSIRAERDSLREALEAANARIAELEGASEMSEEVATTAAALTERTSEVTTLTEQVDRLADALTAEVAKREQIECARAVDELITGGVAPARRQALTDAYATRAEQPAVWAALSERTVPMGVQGVPGSGDVETDQVKRQRLKKQMAEAEDPRVFLTELKKTDRAGAALLQTKGV